MTKFFSFVFVVIISLNFSHGATTGPVGWASVNANGQNGTTGGAGGTVVTVNNMNDLILYCAMTAPYIIQIEGNIPITPKGRLIAVQSHKTIIGITPGAGIAQGGFTIGNNQKNIIFQNLVISDTFLDGDWDGKEQDWDGIQIKGTCHHIWVNHCTFLRQGDGAIDITNGASYITISYCKFGENNKASLIGSSDSDTQTDKYKVSMHHNWFNETTQRHPRVRFGMVHLFNNYYYNMGGYGRTMNYANSNGYGIGVGVSAQVISEHNVFENVVYPVNYFDNTAQPGYFKDQGSLRINSGIINTKAEGIQWDPANHYAYTLLPADEVKALVMQQAGAQHQATPLSRNSKPGQLSLRSFPNPVIQEAELYLYLPAAINIRIVLRDLTGREVLIIAQHFRESGPHTLTFQREQLKPGIYLLSLETPLHSISTKMVLQ